MITPELDSHLMTFLLPTSFLTILVFIVIVCVCNPKSKRFSKHSKSFILSHDIPTTSNGIITNQEFISTAATTAAVITSNNEDKLLNDEHNISNNNNNQKLKPSLNRALPDIPQPSTSNVVINNQLFNSDIEVTDDADSVYTTADKSVSKNTDDNVQNHAYARIRNLITDSSTENDTDDYSDPNVIVNNSSFQSHLINNNNNLPENADNNAAQNLDLLIRNENIEHVDLEVAEPKREISYNTISVREPLAKVLAERENVEHHYNEVEEERISSFYEEINSGSVTYSKINDQKPDNFEPIPSTSSYQQSDESHSNVNPIQDLPLYSLVDKKNKKPYNNQCNDLDNPVACSSGVDPLSNLYTKVIKPKKESNSSTIPLQRYSPPPPLPPPLNHKEGQSSSSSSSSKGHRNTVMFGASTHIFISCPNYSVQANISDNFYEPTPDSNSDKDPGYETVYIKDLQSDNCNNQVDYGYEAISNDPAYEVVSIVDNGYETIKNNNVNERESNNDDYLMNDDDQSDPNYEIIANIKSSTSAGGGDDTSHGQQVLQNNNNGSNTPPLPPPTSYLSVENSDDNVVIIEHL